MTSAVSQAALRIKLMLPVMLLMIKQTVQLPVLQVLQAGSAESFQALAERSRTEPLKQAVLLRTEPAR